MIEYRMPKLAMAMNEGTINEWLVANGDYVEAGQAIAEIETEKTAYECEAPVSGHLEILIAPDTTVAVDTLIGRFHDGLESIIDAPASEPVQQTTSDPEVVQSAAPLTRTKASLASSNPRVIASPAARKLARTNDIDLNKVTGTGPRGRIVKRDVQHLQGASDQQPLASGGLSAGLTPSAVTEIAGSRRTIAARMRESLADSAQVSGHFEADISELMRVRQGLIARAQSLGCRVSMNALIIKAICHAIRSVPEVNACVVDGRIERYEQINLGVAVSRHDTTPGGSLVVAVLHDIGAAGLVEIHERMSRLVERARAGEARADEYQGSTISLSSTAGIAPPGLTSTPILNRPNVFMLGASTPIERPMMVNGGVEPRTMLPVSYTFDHCAIDGEPTARFLAALNDRLQEPALLLT